MSKRDFTLADVTAVKERNEESLFAIPGVTGVGTGYKIKDGKETDELAIVVYVAKKIFDEKLIEEKIPSEIEGIKTDVLEGIFKFQIHEMEYGEAFADPGRYDPLVGGISIGSRRVVSGYVYTGTLGIVISDRNTSTKYLLSNWHVLYLQGSGSNGDIIAQPSLPDGGVSTNNNVGTNVRGVINESVDCAIATTVYRNSTANTIRNIGTINGYDLAVINRMVQKRGRTTGLTRGRIIDLNFSVSVEGRTFRNQIRITSPSRFAGPGDSGSVIVDESTKFVVGLHFASTVDGTTTVANQINRVFGALNVRV